MKGNTDLHTARQRGADEFYTAYDDVSKEISFYPGAFKDKRVFLPCDDWTRSNIYKFFKDNFNSLGLRLLIAQHISIETTNSHWLLYDGLNELIFDTAENDNGDFRDQTAARHFELCDVVVTNPPFSLFREFMDLLNFYNKEYIVFGNINAVTYKEVFPGIVSGRVMLGPSVRSGDREFLVPKWYQLSGTACRFDEETNEKFIRVKGVRWFTNMHPKNINVNMTELTQVYSPSLYQKFDTYDAINVNSIKEIPYDYDGKMGVPITALDKMNADRTLAFKTDTGDIVRYRVIGMLNSGGRPEFYDFAKPIINAKCKFKRIIIIKV